MEALKFKTTIKCEGCIAQSTPFLNKIAGENNWEVDTKNPNKILTVSADNPISEEEIIKAVEAAGFKAEKLE